MTLPHVFDRLLERVRRTDSCVCVGLDPHLDALPHDGGSDDVTRCRRFLFDVVDAIADHVPAVKPQIAFFEQLGPRGYELYFDLIRHAHDRELFVIGDAKRADIGSTAAAYARAHLGPDDGTACDALTVNPYLGFDGVRPFLEVGRATGRGVFVLVRTSNPSGSELQDHGATNGAPPLYKRVGALVEEWGASNVGRSGFSDVGAVVGATRPREAAELRTCMPRSFFLVPGYGAQGASVGDVLSSFRPEGDGALVSSSRGILFAGAGHPDTDPVDAARRAALAMNEDLRRALASPP